VVTFAPKAFRRMTARVALLAALLAAAPALATPPAFTVDGAPWSGGPRFALDGRGERLELAVGPGGWTARVSAPGGPEREAARVEGSSGIRLPERGPRTRSRPGWFQLAPRPGRA
jgi:hypothetical protein